MGTKTPPDLREGVRSGILTSLKRDLEMRGGRTARLLIAAAVIGVVGALGITLMVSGHPFGHHPPWHIAVCSTVWAGLLIVSLSLVFLGVRTPSLPLARSATVAVLGVGIAGICGALCPDQHFLYWWGRTRIGSEVTAAGGLALSALCFGLTTSLSIAAIAAFFALGDRRRPPVRPPLPAAMLLLLLSPGIALQSYDTSWAVFASWMIAALPGCYIGVATGLRLRRLGVRAG